MLGTSITCSAKTGSEMSRIFRTSTNWSPHLRHRNIEDLQTRCGLDGLLHDVPLDPVHHVRRLGLLQDAQPPT